jgi:hypothetical protein
LTKEKKKKENKSTIPKKINKNIAIGIIKEELVDIATLKDHTQQKKKLKIYIEEISKQYTQSSTKKSKRKKKRVYSAKNRSNNRRSY